MYVSHSASFDLNKKYSELFYVVVDVIVYYLISHLRNSAPKNLRGPVWLTSQWYTNFLISLKTSTGVCFDLKFNLEFYLNYYWIVTVFHNNRHIWGHFLQTPDSHALFSQFPNYKYLKLVFTSQHYYYSRSISHHALVVYLWCF